MYLWKNYNSRLFVDRPKILKEMREWADSKGVAQRIWYLLAPPGSGKTWIFRTLFNEWDAHRLVIWVDVPSLVQPEKTGQTELWNMPAFYQWIDDIQKKARKYCPDLPPIDKTLQLPNIISTLVEYICNCKPVDAPIFIVDGYDEVSASQAEEIGFQLLDRLMERSCTRMLIAHRDEWGIRGQVITRNKRAIWLNEYDPLPDDFAKKQFDNFLGLNQLAAGNLDIDHWMKVELKHYCWDHPFINAYLFHCALQGRPGELQSLSSQDLEDCCKEAIERRNAAGFPTHPPLSPQEWKLLVDLATSLPDEWSASDLESIGVPNILDPRLKKLFEYGLIFNNGPFYRVAPGIRELLQDY